MNVGNIPTKNWKGLTVHNPGADHEILFLRRRATIAFRIYSSKLNGSKWDFYSVYKEKPLIKCLNMQKKQL